MKPENWVDTYGDALYRYAMSRVRNPTVAEDLVQETFLAAIQAQQSYGGRSSELTWLTGILRHKTLDFFRKSSRAKEQPLDQEGTEDVDALFRPDGEWASPPGTWPSPQESLERDKFWSTMQGCVAALPEAMRRSFVLREFDGLESNAVAEVLNITTNNLWVVLSRARLRLRECLQKHLFTGNA